MRGCESEEREGGKKMRKRGKRGRERGGGANEGKRAE